MDFRRGWRAEEESCVGSFYFAAVEGFGISDQRRSETQLYQIQGEIWSHLANWGVRAS